MKIFSSYTSLCAKCKGRLWCGKDRCPILVKFYVQTKVKPLIDSTYLEGSSPPSVFIGRWHYPKVFIGPMLPPEHGDTSIMDTPELWTGKSIEEIVNFRFKLVRGKYVTHVKNFNGRIIERTREIALSENSPDAEVEFKTKPKGRIALNSEVQPFGPSAPLIKLDVGNYSFNKRIEKAFYDTDLKSKEAVLDLYKDGVLVSKIQKAFSVGAFGIGKNRRFVPTRWSITAVDDTISKHLMEQVKTFPLINDFRVYEHIALDNYWFVLMIPSYWSYEQMEGWYPKTLWNPSERTEIFSDWEGFEGRTTYPETGGCYFSTRLSTSEYLVKERRQATVITFREIHPGYIMPIGVWHTRQSIREALKHRPIKFNELNNALNYISKKLTIPINNWIENSSLLRSMLYQRKLSDFIKK